MTPAGFRYGFRVIGPATERRRLIDWGAAFRAYLECDARAEPDREAYLSMFTFGGDFRRHLETTGSTAGFAGACWAPFVWFDLDAPSDATGLALQATRRLLATIVDDLGIVEDAVLVFYSGSKGFHVGLPVCLWNPMPGLLFNRIARAFAEHLAATAGVMIDSNVYDRVRIFRAPNSHHPKSGCYKRRITFDELMMLSIAGIVEMARAPALVEWETPTGISSKAAQLWSEAARQVEAEASRRAAVAEGTAGPRLNRLTLAFIREGAAVGERHRLLYSAARNLGEFRCPPALAEALLTESALDSGLPPSDVRRQIECGLKEAVPSDSNGGGA